MKKCWWLLLTVAIGTSLAFAQANSAPISVSLSTRHSTFRLGSPINVELTVKNLSSGSLDLSLPTPVETAFDLRVIDDQGQPARLTEFGRALRGEGTGVVTRSSSGIGPGRKVLPGIKAGDRVWAELTVTQSYIIDKPGKYKIQVSTKEWGDRAIFSNAITVVVTDPTDLPKESAADEPPISLFIIPSTKKVELGSRLVLDILVTNESARELTFGTALSTYGFQVLDSQGNLVHQTETGQKMHLGEAAGGELTIGDVRGGELTSLAPGDDWRQRVTISDLFEMSRPGKYTLQVWRKFGDAIVKSNITDVMITQ